MRNQRMKIREESIVYRPATIDDVPALVNYRIQFLNEHFNHSDDDATKVLRASLSEYFARTIPTKEYISWVAEYEGIIIATSGMVVWKKPAIYGGVESGRLGYLLNFYTVQGARRRGIGTRLLNELIKEARSIGLRYLHLHASEDGIGIYRRAGFSEPGEPELELRLE